MLFRSGVYHKLTRKYAPVECDLCNKEIDKGDTKYSVQFSRATDPPKKGTFIKDNNSADLCHKCFSKFTEAGYKPEWVTMQKNPDGSWGAIDHGG